MPCFERRTISTVLWENANQDRLIKALEALEFRQYVNIQAGALTFSNGVTTVTYDGQHVTFSSASLSEKQHRTLEKTIRQQYAREAVKFAANRYGWNISEHTPGTLVAQKR